MPHPAVSRVLTRFTLVRILALGFVLRVAWILLCPNEPTSDQVLYHLSAADMAEGLGYVDQDGNPAGYWPVGYIALLAPFYALFGPQYWAGYLLNLLLLLIGIAGLHELGKELFGELAGRLAALTFAVHPTFVLHATILASEVAFCAGLPWVILLFVRMARTRSGHVAAVGAGVLTALLTYVRPPALLLLACPPFFLWVERVAPRRVLALSGLVLATAFVVLAPWGFRNEKHFGVFALTSFNGGPNVWMGNHPGSDGTYAALPSYTAKLSLPERDRVLKREALAFVFDNPIEYVSLSARRLVVSLRSDTIGAVWNEIGITRTFGEKGVVGAKILCTLAHWALLAALSAALYVRRRALSRVDAKLALAVGLLSFPFVFLVGGNRYMLPIVPILCVWVASLLAPPSDARTA